MLYYHAFQTRTFNHLFDECNQNWFSVTSIIEDSLTTVKRQGSRLNEAFLRSDNAGCYHCAFLLPSLPSLGQRIGVRIASYDFSEAQAGKDICNHRAAALKSHIRRYINEGNDVKTASHMKLLSTRMEASKAATRRCANLTKVPKHDQALAEWYTVFEQLHVH